MFRRLRDHWLSFLGGRARNKASRLTPGPFDYHRRLFCEALEDRHLLSILTVVSTNDSGAGSLRAAILDATPGDTVQFASSLAGQTINLTSGVLEISKPVTIQGLGAGQLTIDGRYNGLGLPEGVFWVDSTVTASISGLTISRGYSSSFGGGIHNEGYLTVTDSTLFGNSGGSSAGGIYFDGRYGGTLTVAGCTFSADDATWGEGIRYFGPGGTLTVTNSTFSGLGGDAISAQRGTTTVTNSTIAGSSGRGIAISRGTITIRGTTISGNESAGISNFIGTVTVIDSTISANGAYRAYEGGGIDNDGTLVVQNSTIARNSASGAGAGIYRASGTVTLVNTIVAQNANATSPDIFGPVTANFSLIGNIAGATISGTGNLLNQDPLLAWLDSYGGPTQTMPLLPGSPAIDAGDPAAVAGIGDVPLYDQRGAPFTRVFDGDGASGARIDIGAIELQPIPPELPGDYNNDGTVDAADYVVWRKTLGTVGVPAYFGADGSGNGTVGPEDHGVWTAHFGETLPGAGSGGSVEGGVGSGEGANQFRISDFGIRIEDSRESKVESRERNGWQAARGHSLARDDALVAWLASRMDGRGREDVEVRAIVSDEDLHPVGGSEFEALDVAFDALADSVRR